MCAVTNLIIKKKSVFLNRRERNYRVLADKHIHGKKIL